MQYLYSIKDTINAICKKHQKNELIYARIGMRTNGNLHLGNLFPIITSAIIGKELIAKGYGYKLIVIFVDQEINGNDLPFNYLKYSENETLAEYSINNIKNFISELVSGNDDLILEYKTVSESQKTKLFRELLIKIINNSTEIISVYTLCKKCGKLLKNYRKNGINLIYHCDQCKFDYSLNLEDLNEELMLDHDLLGAIENNIFDIDLHILGSDHKIENNGTTRIEKRENYQKIINGDSDYLTLLTPLLLFKNEKMSKSKKSGIFLSEIKAFLGDTYLEKLLNFVQKNNTKSKITINDMRDI